MRPARKNSCHATHSVDTRPASRMSITILPRRGAFASKAVHLLFGQPALSLDLCYHQGQISPASSGFKGARYIIQILCRRYTLWSYPVGLTIADPPGKQKLKYRRVYSRHFHTTIAESIHTTPNSIQCPFKVALYRIQILCRRYTFWSYPAGLTIADPPGKQKLKYRRVYSRHFHTTIAESIHTTPNSI